MTIDINGKTMEQIKVEVINIVLAKHKGCKAKTAKELGLSMKTIYNYLAKNETNRGDTIRPDELV